jgi:pyruvate dehydrogenase E2 component (dihydrolipoamide acetyltransferase)
MFGIKSFSAIINPPQSAILAVGAAERRAIERDGALVLATMMSFTLSVDHRAVDGAIGARWLAAFRAVIENPMSLLV